MIVVGSLQDCNSIWNSQVWIGLLEYVGDFYTAQPKGGGAFRFHRSPSQEGRLKGKDQYRGSRRK